VRDMINGFLMARRWLMNIGYDIHLIAAILAQQ
jgi:hypothetical protein